MTPAEAHFRELANAGNPVPSIVPSDFPHRDITALIHLYAEQPFPVDKLPYSRIFDALLTVFEEKTKPMKYSAFLVFGLLVALRKQERLPLKKV